MVAVTVEFLTGRFVATLAVDRQQHEWPPHPARLFSAIVAAWADFEDAGDLERAAIEWLERQPAPLIAASEATERSVRTHFVPVNDTSVVGTVAASTYDKIANAERMIATAEGAQREKARRSLEKARDVRTKVQHVGSTNPRTGLELLPSRRPRMARHYPSVTPAVPRVQYLWPDSDPSQAIAEALDRILAMVTRLGHSSSLVSCRIDRHVDADSVQVPVWTPDPQGRIPLRTTTHGLLRELEAGFSEHRGCGPRTMPSGVQRYCLLDTTSAHSEPQVPDNAGEWFVFAQVSGRRLPILAAANLATTVRAALMRYAADPVPELISGHGAESASSIHPHLAVMALPFVGREHADGHLLGFAVLLPNSSPLLSDRDEVLRAIGRWEGSDQSGRFQVRILLRGGEELRFKRIHDSLEMWSLRRNRWAGPAQTWVSVTPIALDRHPGNLGSHSPETAMRAAQEAEKSIRTACEHVGITQPSDVAVTRSALVAGSRPARSFPAFRGGGSRSPQRLLVHARIHFETEVRGPLLLGAGRYLGLGLMAPGG
uniref:CRISPR-associated protein, family (Cas_GSU0054) n=1 Tax=Mycobacterium riyadhense TaxID=486698 RepID=A0A653ETY3_9MYCO|nr:CRISPR-associated protein, family (Cas_GSU0054) [Mycobacterium riyadhense]